MVGASIVAKKADSLSVAFPKQVVGCWLLTFSLHDVAAGTEQAVGYHYTIGQNVEQISFVPIALSMNALE